MPEAVAITRPRVVGDPVVGVCPSPIAPCLQILLDAATDVLLQNVQDQAGAPITSAVVSAEIFDVDDLVNPLTTIVATIRPSSRRRRAMATSWASACRSSTTSMAPAQMTNGFST